MKTKKLIENSSRLIAAILLSGATTVAIWSVSTYDKKRTVYYSHNTISNIEKTGTLDNGISEAGKMQMKAINANTAWMLTYGNHSNPQ